MIEIEEIRNGRRIVEECEKMSLSSPQLMMLNIDKMMKDEKELHHIYQ